MLGCFATVAQMIKDGDEAYTLILSKGKQSRGATSSDEIALLSDEMTQANNLIGIKKVFQFNFPDNMFDSIPMLDIVQVIEKIKYDIKPNIIFTHHFGDINIDHQIVYKAVLTATRPIKDEPVKTIYTMEIPSSTEWNAFTKDTAFIPNVFFDITNTIDLKVDAMAIYDSELREYPHPRSLKYLKELAHINGVKVGVRYTENFYLVRSIR